MTTLRMPGLPPTPFDPLQPPNFAAFKFRYSASLHVDWPPTADHNDMTHWATYKTGISIKTGLPAAEYACGSSRVWLLADGSVEED